METELKYSLEKMKMRKSPRPGGIKAELLKYGGDKLHKRLLSFINECYRFKKIHKHGMKLM